MTERIAEAHGIETLRSKGLMHHLMSLDTVTAEQYKMVWFQNKALTTFRLKLHLPTTF